MALSFARFTSLAALTAVLGLTSGCQSMVDDAYFSAMEQVGVHKRDLLSSRIEDSRDAQEEAKVEFQSALDEFKSVTAFQGGDLEATYNRLNSAYESSQASAEDVSEKINGVERVSTKLFAEWEAELEQYTSASLKQQSAAQLRETQAQYNELMASMRKAEQSMQPVLAVFGDQVLFLKHNLNARAIASLKNEVIAVESDVNQLINEMNRSIAEANDFLATFEQ